MVGSRRVKSFEDLEVWKAADRLAHNVFRVTKSFPSTYLYDLSSQLRRAALSVPANIVEGSASLHSKELIQALNISRRSLAETRYLLLFAHEEDLISTGAHEEVLDSCESVGKMLSSLVRSIRSKRGSTNRA